MIFRKILSNLINNFLSKISILIIFRNGEAIGEHVYMSSVIREISMKKERKILLFTNKYDIYLNNPRIFKLFKLKKKSFIWFFLNNFKGKSILEFSSKYATKKNHENNNVSLHKGF